MIIEAKAYLIEMAKLLSLVELQKKGNKTPATRSEIKNAQKQAMSIKTPSEARNAANEAYLHMRKKEIIQVFLDREAVLRNPTSPVPKPLFMDKKIIKWGDLDKIDIQQAINWLVYSKSGEELDGMLKAAEIALRNKITNSNKIRVSVYKKAKKAWDDGHKRWKINAKAASLEKFY